MTWDPLFGHRGPGLETGAPPAPCISVQTRSSAHDVHGLRPVFRFLLNPMVRKPQLNGYSGSWAPALPGTSLDPHSAICPGEWTGDGDV